MKKAGISPIAVALTSILLAGCGLQSGGHTTGSGSSHRAKPTPKTFNVSGTFELNSSSGIDSLGGDGDTCSGMNGYDDIRNGTQVVIKNAESKTVAFGALHGAKLTNDWGTCRFIIDVRHVPRGQGPYAIEVAQRGSYNFTEDSSFVQLSLGDS